MEKKKIWKWIWVPVLTALLIAAGAFALGWAMKADQASLTNQTIAQKPSQTVQNQPITPQPSSPASDGDITYQISSSGELPAESGALIYEGVTIPDTDYDMFKMHAYGDPEPDAKDISYKQAGTLGAKAFESAFREDATKSGAQIGVEYNKPQGVVDGYYAVTYYKKGWSVASYSCTIDAVSGHFKSLGRLTELGANKPEPSPTFTMNGMINEGNYRLDGLLNAAGDDPQVKERAAGIVKDNFLYGRTIKEVQIDGVQAAYSTAYDVGVDCYVRMSEGECYCIHIAYPTYEVISIDFIPIWPFDEGTFPGETATNN